MTRQEIKAKLDEIVDFAGVEKYLDTPVKRYSSGMHVRLGFAVAAHLEPDILVVDEVLAVGDAEFQKKAIGKMQEVSQGEGRTVLFVSHNMASVSTLCSRALLLSNGQIQQRGNVSDIIYEYLNEDKKNIDISARNDRKGNGKVRIKKLYILDKLNNEINKFLSGSNIKICLEYEFINYYVKDEDFNLGLQIFDKTGRFITILNNRMSNFKFINTPHKGLITCQLDKLPLMVGEFFITINLKIGTETSDYIENAYSFTVIEGDFYNSGMPNSGNRQGVYLEQKWKING